MALSTALNGRSSAGRKRIDRSPQRIASTHLPNAYRLHAKVISGGQPEGDAAFKELRDLGVRTIISVDGATPDVATANKYGLRYVHLPHGYDDISTTRAKELELRRTLREMRTAIDRFHDDWMSRKISKTNSDASDDGYPRSLDVLVNGTEGSDAKGGKRRYLRRVPADPFAASDKPPSEQWVIRGYQDDADAVIMSGKDVYDVRSQSEREALDGTRYRDW